MTTTTQQRKVPQIKRMNKERKPENGIGARKSYETAKPFRPYRDLRSNIARQRDVNLFNGWNK